MRARTIFVVAAGILLTGTGVALAASQVVAAPQASRGGVGRFDPFLPGRVDDSAQPGRVVVEVAADDASVTGRGKPRPRPRSPFRPAPSAPPTRDI